MIATSLIVLQPFLDYKKGQEIFDSTEIEIILNGDNSNYVIKSSYEKLEEVDNFQKIEASVDNKIIEFTAKSEVTLSRINSKDSKEISKSK